MINNRGIKEVSIEKKFYTAKYDAVFKAVFCNPNNRDLLKWIIEKCLNRNIEIIKVESPEIIKNNIYVKNKTLDVLVKTEKELLNIELNSGYYSSLHRRNAGYIFSKYSEETKVGEDYLKMKNHIQINFSINLPKRYPLLGIYKLNDLKTEIEFIDNLTIYEFNVDKIKERCYNEDNKEYNFIAILNSNNRELEKLCKGDKYMEKFKEEVERLNEDSTFTGFLSAEEDAKKVHNTLIGEAREEGFEEAIIKTTKNMLNKNMDITIISEITGLTKSQIENLK